MLIIRIATIAALIFTLVGCSSQVSKQINTTVQATVKLTDADLQTAIIIAKTATPPDTEAVMCYSWLDANLDAVQTVIGGGTPPTVVGVFSAFELAHLTTNNMQYGISPVIRTGFEMNCGPFAANIIGGVQGLVNTIAGDAAGLQTTFPGLTF